MLQRVLAESLRIPAIVSGIAVVPFIALELKNRPAAEFPIWLFAFLWAVAAACLAVLAPAVHALRNNDRMPPASRALLGRIAIALLLATLWSGVLLDQMPCFLGVVSCD